LSICWRRGDLNFDPDYSEDTAVARVLAGAVAVLDETSTSFSNEAESDVTVVDSSDTSELLFDLPTGDCARTGDWVVDGDRVPAGD